jgi:hypothetical protein
MGLDAARDLVHIACMNTTNTCERCRKQFTPHYTTGGKQRFCSKKCRYDAWVEANRERLNATVRRYRARRYKQDGCWRDNSPKSKAAKEWMVNIKSQPCADCGGRFPVCCMDFDHKAGEKKTYNVGTMFAHHYSIELIKAEVSKCDLVCANCHRIRTQKRRTGNGKHK